MHLSKSSLKSFGGDCVLKLGIEFKNAVSCKNPCGGGEMANKNALSAASVEGNSI